jgi:MoxR-like ATPase
VDGSQQKQRALTLTAKVGDLRKALNQQVIGQSELIEHLLIGILAGGHVLLEGLPGLGKTLLVRMLGNGLGLEFSRIQFTPDLMPADVTGTLVVDEQDGKRTFRFQKGPVFAGLVLADEINRATPKTQSALLEAMQEGTVTTAGESHRLPEPFHVIATQNPIELEGTYPLPEAQLDRFLFKLEVKTPTVEAMVQILAGTTSTAATVSRPLMTAAELRELQGLVREVLCGTHLVRLVAEILAETHPQSNTASDRTRRFVRFGASARAGQAIILGAKARALMAARPAVTREDIDACLLPALRHRVLLGYEAEAASISAQDLVQEWVAAADRRAR